MRKRLKKKKRSCVICKPHKMGFADRRTNQWKKADEKFDKEVIYE